MSSTFAPSFVDYARLLIRLYKILYTPFPWLVFNTGEMLKFALLIFCSFGVGDVAPDSFRTVYKRAMNKQDYASLMSYLSKQVKKNGLRLI